MRIIPVIIFACLSLVCAAQPGTFTLGIMPEGSGSDFTEVHLQKVESKLIDMINNSNEATVGYNNDFVLAAKLSAGETGRVEGGMQNITVTTIEVSLMIKQVGSNVIYNSVTKKVKGSGSTKEAAIANALSTWNISDNSYAQFIATGRDKIIKYYQDNCNQIIQWAANYEAKKDYEQALSLLQSVPPAAPCYKTASKKAVDMYVKYQKNLCTRQIAIARSEIAIRNYERAAEVLQMIEPTSGCATESKQLMAEISGRIDKLEHSAYNLEAMRINAIKEIAKAYYTSKVRSSSHRRH